MSRAKDKAAARAKARAALVRRTQIDLGTTTDAAGRKHSVHIAEGRRSSVLYALVDEAPMAATLTISAKRAVEEAIAGGVEPAEAVKDARGLIARARAAGNGKRALCLATLRLGSPDGDGRDHAEALAIDYVERASEEEHLLCREVEPDDISPPRKEADAHGRRSHGPQRAHGTSRPAAGVR